jgi:hypothetical protein
MRWCHNQRSRPPAGQLQTLRRDLEELRRFYQFRDFAHFIEVYLAVVALIRTPQDIGYLTYEVAREMAVGQQLRYAELTCTPYTSVRPHENGVGMPIEAYTEALEDARVAAERDFGLVLRWIYDIPGEFGLPAADATLDYALHHRPEGLVAFGLGGPEIGCRDRSSDRISTPHGRPVCTACPTPVRPPGRRPSGTRCGCSARRGSGTAPPPRRTPSCWPTWPRPAYRSRCARPPTSPPGRSRRSRSTRCRSSTTRA